MRWISSVSFQTPTSGIRLCSDVIVPTFHSFFSVPKPPDGDLSGFGIDNAITKNWKRAVMDGNTFACDYFDNLLLDRSPHGEKSRESHRTIREFSKTARPISKNTIKYSYQAAMRAVLVSVLRVGQAFCRRNFDYVADLWSLAHIKIQGIRLAVITR